MAYCDWGISNVPIEEMIGVTMRDVRTNGVHEIVFEAVDGRSWVLHHHDCCCESVTINDIAGNLNDIIGAPMTVARLDESFEDPPMPGEYVPESFTWSFYAFATRKGHVVIRWFGQSNGYYSETVCFCRRAVLTAVEDSDKL